MIFCYENVLSMGLKFHEEQFVTGWRFIEIFIYQNPSLDLAKEDIKFVSPLAKDYERPVLQENSSFQEVSEGVSRPPT